MWRRIAGKICAPGLSVSQQNCRCDRENSFLNLLAVSAAIGNEKAEHEDQSLQFAAIINFSAFFCCPGGKAPVSLLGTDKKPGAKQYSRYVYHCSKPGPGSGPISSFDV